MREILLSACRPNVEVGGWHDLDGPVAARSVNGLGREGLVKTFIRHPPAA